MITTKINWVLLKDEKYCPKKPEVYILIKPKDERKKPIFTRAYHWHKAFTPIDEHARNELFNGGYIYAWAEVPVWPEESDFKNEIVDIIESEPSANLVDWDWLKNFAEGKRYNYCSDFIFDAESKAKQEHGK